MVQSVHELLASLAGDVSGRRVVDLGAGTGGTLAVAGATNDAALALVVDVHAPALRARTDDSMRLVADLSRPLPLRDASFDVVLSHNVLECLTDPSALLAECRRLLVPGGRLVVSHTEFDSITIHARDRELCRRVLRAYCDLPVLYVNMANADSQLGRRLPGLVQQGGFRLLQVVPHLKLETTYGGDAAIRIEEMAESVRQAVAASRTDLTAADVERWLEDLMEREAAGDFFFSETAYAVVASC